MLFARLRKLERDLESLRQELWRRDDWMESSRLRRENEKLTKQLEKLEAKIERK